MGAQRGLRATSPLFRLAACSWACCSAGASDAHASMAGDSCGTRRRALAGCCWAAQRSAEQRQQCDGHGSRQRLEVKSAACRV
ncbi:hypothetical protein P171DRAFT_153243 [Karstenula rhodostoma CBS 690.94]|uniref:Secreted protein n=1 Tax=Karstenula rhodostoma CBS 690.94 TaxID=1392251 RepID=A0A9P4PTL8_9PLEO|nr:hypothetical protein P171DRAFT_153243 [Karstenula rhodostoma CBS 690.94]